MVKRRSGAVVWLTGLSGAGKSTIAQEVCRRLACQDIAVECLDGDVVRGIFPATGFSRADRDTHIRRIGYMASRLEYHGVIVVAALISPYRASRDFVRGLCENFVEVFVSTPLEVCEARDVKGLYARARNGEIRQFTGIDDAYEPPLGAEIEIDTREVSVDDAATQVISRLIAHPFPVLRGRRGSDAVAGGLRIATTCTIR